MSLKQSDLEQALYGALINAFDRASLSQLLRFHLGKRLDLISGDNDNLAQTVTSIIDKSTQEGWTTQLIEAAQQNNPTNQLLKQLDPSDFKYTPIASTSTPKHIRLAIGILVFATISSLIYLTLFSQKPQQMSGDFRIAVAGFTEQSPSVSSNSRIGMELAESVSLLLQKNIDEVHLDFIMTIWGPERVRIIEGGNEIERAIAAAQLAEEIGADLVVYGVVEQTNATWKLLPEFYIPAANFHEAGEIVGPHRLGSSLSFIQQGNVAERIEASRELTSRTQILTQIAIGLAYYAIFDYDQAYKTFASVTEFDFWEELEGQEVVFLLTGNAAIKRGDLNLAEKNYQTALNLNPSYSRGYLGIAGVHYLQSLKAAGTQDNLSKIDMVELEMSIDNFHLATTVSDQPPLANIAEKAHFGLAQVYLAQALGGDEQMLDQASLEFREVIAAYGSGENPTLRQFAAESHARLGLMHTLSDNNLSALGEYQMAVTLLVDNPERQALYQKRVDDLTEALNAP